MSIYLTFAPTLLLYLGALLSGWAGGGLAVLLPLWLAFLLWHVVMRPAEWPRDSAHWTGAKVVQVAIAAVVLLGLAAAFVGLGWGLSVLVPPPPAFPVWVGIALAVLATPLQRWVHDPRAGAALEVFLDDALRQVEAAPAAASTDADAARLRAALLSGQPDLYALSGQHGPWPVLDALSALQDENRLSAPLAQAMIRWVCDPGQTLELQGIEAPYVTLTLVQDDPGLVTAFAHACIALLRADPEAFWDCPSNRMLRQVQQRHAGTDAALALRALRIEQICVTRERLARSRAELLALMQESADKPGP